MYSILPGTVGPVGYPKARQSAQMIFSTWYQLVMNFETIINLL